jgi:hypothetical protein
MRTATPIAPDDPTRAARFENADLLVDDLVALRALVESLCVEVDLQREQLGALRRAVLSFGSSPDGRILRIPDRRSRPGQHRTGVVPLAREDRR